MTTQTAMDDDIFARPPRALARQQLRSGRITCRVCAAKATVPLDHPALLCVLCLRDLDATRARVASWLAAALSQLDTNAATWNDALRTSDAAEKWPAIQAALLAVAERRATPAALRATWAKRIAQGGALAALLLAHDAYTRECDRLGVELSRLHAAQVEINTASLDEGV